MIPEFDMDFCNLLPDPKRRHEPGDQAWAATLVMVDVAAQNPLCAAVSSKSDESAYLTAMCAAFVKRMASRTCVEIVGGQDRSESEHRWNSTQSRGIPKIQQSEHWRSRASTRCSGKSDSMLASRVGNASPVDCDSSHGCVAVDGETRWMVA